jgi:hypothetical protein
VKGYGSNAGELALASLFLVLFVPAHVLGWVLPSMREQEHFIFATYSPQNAPKTTDFHFEKNACTALRKAEFRHRVKFT